MTDEIKETTDKPLDKMTVTQLREVAKELPHITGVHGMKKAELLEAITKAKGIEETPREKEVSQRKAAAKSKGKKVASIKDLKVMIKALRSQRSQALMDKNKKMARIYRRRISRLKKKTRQAA